jgi:nucleoside 2-deoxyribosyltransferase
MKIYLASPFFTKWERHVMERVLNKMRTEGHEVYAPYEHEIDNAWGKSNIVWGLEVFTDDVKAIQECDEVWAINHGMESDTGTAWECGYAYGINKPVRVLCIQRTNSLMVIGGCEEYDLVWNYLTDKDCGFDIEVK